jgi:hypothetical protein
VLKLGLVQETLTMLIKQWVIGSPQKSCDNGRLVVMFELSLGLERSDHRLSPDEIVE